MSDTTHTILLACDNDARAEFLGSQFADDAFDVLRRDSHDAALRAIERQYPDLVIADLQLPGGGALGILDALRAGAGQADPLTPVVVIADRDDAIARVRVLERGADDVVGPLLHYPELLARVRGVLRRRSVRERDRSVRIGQLTIDQTARVARLGDTPLELSGKEYALLTALAREPQRVFDKAELLREVWGFQASAQTRTLDSHACRLRRKLRAHGVPYVINVWGIGYRLLDPLQAHQHAELVAA